MSRILSKMTSPFNALIRFFESGEYASNSEIETHRHFHVKRIHTESISITRELVSLD